MFYVTFHSIGNVWVYDDTGKQTATALLATPSCAPALSELRGMTFGPHGYLYVCNGYKTSSQVLVYVGGGGSNAGYAFIGIYADPTVSAGLAHPFSVAFDSDNNAYVSSQDTNVVTALTPPATGQPCDATPTPPPYSKATPLAVASYLQGLNLGTFLPGTFVASAYGALNGVTPAPPKVSPPQGLEVSPPTGPAANSVRDVLVYDGSLYVVDEPGNAVKIYALATGQLMGQIPDPGSTSPVGLTSPVHLLPYQGRLYISNATSVLVYDLDTKTLSAFLSNLSSPAGMAFDSSGNFYFADRNGQVIYQSAYDAQNKQFGTPAVFIPKYDKKHAPDGLQDDPEFLLFVAG